MNPSIESKIAKILQSTEPGIREDLARHLADCQFTDTNDPALNGLAAQALIAGQPVRLIERGGDPVATEAGLARLGDRFENGLWAITKLRLGVVAIACALTLSLGAGGVLVAFKIWGATFAGWFDLPRAEDGRIGALSDIGAALKVERHENTTYVYFDGQNQPKTGQTKDGLEYFYFKQP